jgi:hypothetical protein
VELPGIEPELLPGNLLCELEFRFVPAHYRSLPAVSLSCLDGVNKNRFPFQGQIRPVRLAYT